MQNSKRITDEKINIVFAMLAVLTLLIGIVPIIRLAIYATPFYDDFSYGMNVKWYLDGMYPDSFFKHGLVSVVLKTINEFWYSWQGTYGSLFFMSLMPGSFGERYYFVGCVAIVVCLTMSSFLLTNLICKYYTKGTRSTRVIISSAMSLYLVELIYTSHQGYYWYNGAVHYTFMHGLLFFLISLVLALLNAKRMYSKILLGIGIVLLSFLVAGANFTTALQGACILVLLLGISCIKKNSNMFYSFPGVLVYAGGIIYSCLAPGNDVRARFYTGYGAFKSIYCSIIEALYEIPKFSGLVTIGIMILLAPFLYDLVKNNDYDFKCPGLVSIFSFLMYATGFTPSFFAMGNAGLDRTWNVVKFTYQILLILNEAYWIGWMSNNRKKLPTKLNLKLILMPMGIAVIALSFILSTNKAGEFSSYGAYYYVHTGEAACYKQECEYRLDEINEANGGDVLVSPHVFKPWLLCGNNELSYDSNAEQNRFMAQFYHVNSIALDPETETDD